MITQISKSKLVLAIFSQILFVFSAIAKTTYIPTYWSYLKIFQYNADSVYVQSQIGQTELLSPDETFRITIVHEDVTHEKVKAIKRAKNAAGWAIVATMLSGFSAGFNATYYNNAMLTYVDMRRVENAAVLSNIMQEKVSADQRLSIDFFIDNLSNQELVISDQVRGLVWYILPHTSMQFNMPNPGAEHLRISDLNNKNIQYADIIGANYVKKENIEWEDDECWITIEDDFYDLKAKNEMKKYTGPKYTYINKATYDSHEISAEEVKRHKKQIKINQN